MIQFLLRPGILFSVQFRNTMRYTVSAVLFSVPALLALWAHPELLGSPFAIAMGGAFLLALYYHVCFYAGAQLSWAEINKVTQRINDKDLTPLPPAGIDAGMLAQVSKGQFGTMLKTLRSVHEGWRDVVGAARASVAGGAQSPPTSSRRATSTSRSAPSSRPPRSRKPPRAWRSSPRRSRQNAENCKLASELSRSAAGVGATRARRWCTAWSRRWS